MNKQCSRCKVRFPNNELSYDQFHSKTMSWTYICNDCHNMEVDEQRIEEELDMKICDVCKKVAEVRTIKICAPCKFGQRGARLE